MPELTILPYCQTQGDNFNFCNDNLKAYKWFRLTVFTLDSSVGYLSQCQQFSSGFKFIWKSCCITFSRYEVYHNKAGSLDLEKFLPTSTSITLYIRRAYLQAYLWYHCVFTESVDINPEDFDYLRNENKQLIPEIINNSSIPESFPKPSKLCNMCTKKRLWMSENVYYLLQLAKLSLTHILSLCPLLIEKVKAKAFVKICKFLAMLNFW